MNQEHKNLLLFFDRPLEPITMPKGDLRVTFRLPPSFLLAEDGRTRRLDVFIPSDVPTEGLHEIIVNDIAKPDISHAKALPKDGHFSVFLPEHMKMANQLIKIFLEAKNLSELKDLCAYTQINVNPYLFIYSLTVAIVHRPDTKILNGHIPSLALIFPQLFFDLSVVALAKKVSRGHVSELPTRISPVSGMPKNIQKDSTQTGTHTKIHHFGTYPDGNRTWDLKAGLLPTHQSALCYSGIRHYKSTIEITPNQTASDLLPEQRLAYFREDVGVNLHHWHWHVVYPYIGDPSVVNKDRRGELFYYMHEQLVARYRTERICNGCERVKSLDNLRERIPEAYFPKLTSDGSSQVWPHRSENLMLSDVNRPELKFAVTVQGMEEWRANITNAINNKYVEKPDGSRVTLDDETGIDVLGNVVEASILSPNQQLYGNLHNMGHVMIGFIHDPDNLYLEPNGVMGSTTTAVRDPVFYCWHMFIDDLFTLHKNKLKPYEPAQLIFTGISVSSINIKRHGDPDNQINTHRERSVVNLKRGLDFVDRKDVFVKIIYLQHKEFDYVIEVENNTGDTQMGFIRIFMAPTKDEDGNKLSYNQQRRLMIEMDKFSQTLNRGKNTITRNSKDSSVTIPYEQVFPDDAKADGDAASDYCGCGWPDYMLVPRGTEAGEPMVLFVMVTNWNEDKVEPVQPCSTGKCKDGASYCGLQDHKYPDRRPMGFPFDRPAPAADTLEQFLQPNMATRNCTIKFTDIIVDRPI